MDKIQKSTSEWKSQLDPEQFRVTREAGTEAPFSGEYCDHFEDGSYECVCCGHSLFDSSGKFHSGCGRPAR
jgi:peptide-methionine (R)-S-oxide reductase